MITFNSAANMQSQNQPNWYIQNPMGGATARAITDANPQ
jgi:hypothetical protein